ncbi:MAG: hypothetical protein IJ496_05390 [Ruminococcus sp.]|nr:hypothetical protein [Ruminococcus sp.]
MIRKQFRKFGEARGFVTSNGICYGESGGYTVTLEEEFSTGCREVYFTVTMEQEAYDKIVAAARELQNTYGMVMNIQPTCIYAKFTGKKAKNDNIAVYLDTFPSRLDAYGCKGSSICPFCKLELGADRATKLVGGRAVRMHGGCAEQLIYTMQNQEQAAAEQKSKAGKGLLGAVLFGVAAAIPWAIVYALGYFVAWLGALIGMAVVKGYDKFGGIVKKSTIAIFAVLIVLLVIFAQLLGDVFQIGYLILQGEVWGSLADIPSYLNMLFADSEYISGFVGNILIGILFAGLGVFGIFRSLIAGVSSQSKKIVDLPDGQQ